jgi:hypothetical protein
MADAVRMRKAVRRLRVTGSESCRIVDH